MKKVLITLLTLFSVLFLYYPASYAITDLKPLITFIIICYALTYIVKRFNIKIQVPENKHILIILILTILSRFGIVFLFNNKITQISDFALAFEAAKSGFFQNEYYQVFTNWIMYPAILNIIFKIFGSTQLIALIFNAFIALFTAILLYKISSKVFDSKNKGLICTIIYIIWPSNILYITILTPEHVCSLLLLLALYLLLIIIENDFFQNKKQKLFALSVFIGIILSFSSFFKNFSYVFITAIIIYHIINYLKNSVERTHKTNIKEILFSPKLWMIGLCILAYFVSNIVIYNVIENHYVKAPVVKNVIPCYLNVGLRDKGIYSKENYQMYFDSYKKNNYDYKKTNKEIIANLKTHLKTKQSSDIIDLFNRKAKIIFGNDESKINFTISSLNDKEGGLAHFMSTTIKKINNYYFLVIVFLSILGLISLIKYQNLRLFISYLTIFGGLLMILIVEGQNSYMYSLQPFMCITAVSGITILVNYLKKHIKPKVIKEKISTKSLLFAGIFLISFIFFNILIPSILFLFKIGVPKISAYLSIFAPVFIIYGLLKNQKLNNLKNIMISIVLPIIIITFSIFLSGKLFDSTWDGNMYHKAAIGYLMDGWNPVYEDIQTFDKKQENPKDLLEWSHLWIDHYPKASYIYGASIGVNTKTIESGKSINIISMFALFFFSLSLFLYHKKDIIFSILMSIIVISSTTIVSQLFTNFIDGLVYVYIYILMYFFIANESKGYAKKFELYLIYSIVLSMLINIKFSSFGYAGIISAGYYILYFIRMLKDKNKVKEFMKFTALSICIVMISIFVIGVSVYPKNFIDHGHPFYPLMGEGKKEIMKQETLYSLENASPLKKFFVSTYSEATNQSRASREEAKLKIPFSIHQNELQYAQTFDLRISGNGLLFSGIFSICLFLIIPLMARLYKENKKQFVVFFIPLLSTIFLLLIMEDLWWARYFPQIHFIVFIVILLLEKYYSKSKLLKFLIIMTMLNNFMFFIGNSEKSLSDTYQANKQITQFRTNWSPTECDMYIYSLIFPGGYFNLEEKLPEYSLEFTSTEIDQPYQYILNNGYAAGICKEE